MAGLPPLTLVPLTLVLGGARSGKSRYAEGLVSALAPPWIYMATAEAFDGEMAERIAHHQQRRGPGWQTVDVALELDEAIRTYRDRPVLVDCLTLWLNNLLYYERDVAAAADRLAAALGERSAPAVVVANEVGLGLVPESALSRRFRDEAGRLNQRMAAMADRVVFCVAGIAMPVKDA